MNSLQWLLLMETFFWGIVLRWKLLYNANFYFAISLSFLMFFLFLSWQAGFRDYSQSLPSHCYWACWKYHRMISHDSLQARLTEGIDHWFQIVVKHYLYLYNVAANSHIQLEDFYYSYCAAGTPRSIGIRPQDISWVHTWSSDQIFPTCRFLREGYLTTIIFISLGVSPEILNAKFKVSTLNPKNLLNPESFVVWTFIFLEFRYFSACDLASSR